jgi:hypothetical protein
VPDAGVVGEAGGLVVDRIRMVWGSASVSAV